MAYALDARLYLEDGPAAHASRKRRSLAAYRGWRTLDAERRLALVETAVAAAANEDRIDEYPVAL